LNKAALNISKKGKKNNMAWIKDFTRGGQINLHNLRMIRQVFTTGIAISVLLGVVYFVGKASTGIPKPLWYQAWQYHKADLFLSLSPPSKHATVKQVYTDLHGRQYERLSNTIIHDPKVIKCERWVAQQLTLYGWQGIYVSAACFFLLLCFWVGKGYSNRQSKQERGSLFLSKTALRRRIIRRRCASDLQVDNLPLIKNRETSHMLATGTTGAGKSTLLFKLLPQIRRRPNRAIIVDMTGDYVARFYDPSKDLILNPFDQRSQKWSLWAEYTHDYECDQLAAALVPRSVSVLDPFWEKASKTIISTALQKVKREGSPSIAALFKLLVMDDLKEFGAFFRGTEAAPYTDKEGERMAVSVRASLATHMQGLKYIEEATPPEVFSIREWVKKESHPDQWLFITAMPNQRESLRPFMTAWLDIALNALMSLSPDEKRRLWFIIDELPSLFKIPSLLEALAEARKYGGCIFAGMQGMPQLTMIYPHSEAQAILSLFNTFFFFSSPHETTTHWASKVLGEIEETKVTENVSYGANTIRDGVSLNQNTHKKQLVLETEISNLKSLEAFIRLPENFPRTKVKMKYEEIPKTQIPFVDRTNA